MKNMDKELTIKKWVLINQPKIPQMPQNLSTQIVCSNPKDWDFDEKMLYWASIIRGQDHDKVRNENKIPQGILIH